MKEIKGLDLQVYRKKIDNGLDIIIIPNNKINNTYATYTTKYGGMDNEFYIDSKLVKVPMGIAHFLEHKMFEMEDGSDVFNFFAERGSNCNANTNSKKTTYLFNGPNCFYENLKFLLKYVEEPYFTDENVNKEKGIIEQEMMMYKDNPYSRLYDEIMYNVFINHPLKYPVIGTKESINKITKEDLYDCYNTFYHPSNMFLIITGNVDYKKAFDIIENHENKRKIEKKQEIKRKKYKEPNEVFKKEVTVNMDVTTSKVAIAYKINVSKIKMDINKIYSCLLNMFDLTLGSTSLFTENMRKEGLITDTFDISAVKADNHIILIIVFKTLGNVDKVINNVLKEVKKININSKDLERRKKSSISSLLFISDNIFNLNGKIMSDIVERGDILYDPIDSIKKITINDNKNIIKNINLDNYSIIKILPN